MRKSTFAMAATLLASATVPAQAAVSFSDNFDAEGATSLNYTGFANWDVTDGTVDLISDPNQYGISCGGGGGSCVDLDGSTSNAGILTTKQIFSVAAGEQITVKFDMRGNQRNGASDDVYYGFQFINPALGNQDVFIGSFTANQGYATYQAQGSYNVDTQFKLFFRNVGGDNVGAILDNVSLTATAVPEPATWAMMITGFGFVGGSMRRRANRTTASFA